MPYWQELSHLDFIRALEKTRVAVLLTGALEAHGNHLPLGTDNILPSFLAKSIAERTNALILPPVTYGDSWVFNQFEGTISVEPSTLVNLYMNIMKGTFKQGIKYIVALNGHGGNSGHIETAAKLATEKGERVVVIINWWRDLAGSARGIVLETPEGHAAEDETSEVMHVAPNLVTMESAKSARVITQFRIVSAQYRRELLPNAMYGDPRKATKEKGQLIMKQAADELVDLIENLEKDKLPLSGEP